MLTNAHIPIPTQFEVFDRYHRVSSIDNKVGRLRTLHQIKNYVTFYRLIVWITYELLLRGQLLPENAYKHYKHYKKGKK